MRDHYIRRVWTWITGLGILLALAGVVVFYDHINVLEPLRLFFRTRDIDWVYRTVYCLSLSSVVISFLLNFNKSEKKLVEHADKADLKAEVNPSNSPMSPLEHRSLFILKKITKTENLQWNAATWPGFLGTILFVLEGGFKGLLLYVAISLVTGFFHRPSMEATEAVIEQYIRRRSPPLVSRDQS